MILFLMLIPESIAFQLEKQMDDKLLNYYENELTFIRKMGVEFANKHPDLAKMLLLERDRCSDPHTERLIEAFAFISGRIHKKIDDDFPEITESFFSILYPHYINPIPSMSVVKFNPSLKDISETGYEIEKKTVLYSEPVGGNPCQFTTCYPVTLFPLEVVSAELGEPKKLVEGAVQSIVIRLRTHDNLEFSQIDCGKLRFFLNGSDQQVFHLYELLFNNVCRVECESTNQQGESEVVSLTPDDIGPVGFNTEEYILPYSSRSFPGYISLFEYFCFPHKFLFFDLNGLNKTKGLGFNNDTLDICIYLKTEAKSSLVVDKDTFCLYATPVVNLFKRTAENIRIEHLKNEYRVIPDIRRQDATEVYSVDRVSASSSSNFGKGVEYKPFYSLKHHLGDEDETKAYWHIHRRESGRKGDDGTEVYLSFTDLDFDNVSPESEKLLIHTTCTNRDLPARLPFTAEKNGKRRESDNEDYKKRGVFSMEIAAPVEYTKCLMQPTRVRRPALGGKLQWRLISHLSLNYLSIVQGGEEALKEILSLYDFDNSQSTKRQISGIVSLKSEYVTKRIGQSFCRGVRVTLECDENKFGSRGFFLFASILERFLGQYVSVNSFSQLAVKAKNNDEVLKEWSHRSGNRVLL